MQERVEYNAVTMFPLLYISFFQRIAAEQSGSGLICVFAEWFHICPSTPCAARGMIK
jgi:hypothetical protein